MTKSAPMTSKLDEAVVDSDEFARDATFALREATRPGAVSGGAADERAALLKEARNAATAVYLAAEEGPAGRLSALLTRLADALESGEARSGWRPIATAPKGRAPVIVYDGDYVGEALFIVGEGWYWAQTHPTDAVGPDQIYPTHWQPLPEPPPAGDAQTEGEGS